MVYRAFSLALYRSFKEEEEEEEEEKEEEEEEEEEEKEKMEKIAVWPISVYKASDVFLLLCECF